jgi:hypothetical protein
MRFYAEFIRPYDCDNASVESDIAAGAVGLSVQMMPTYCFCRPQSAFENLEMSANLIEQTERRKWPRFAVSVPLVVVTGDHAISGYSRDVSDRGVYFYLNDSDSTKIDSDFEFLLKLPPEITFSTWSSIRGSARLVRKDPTPKDSTGIAAEILQYSIVRAPVSYGDPGRDDQLASS